MIRRFLVVASLISFSFLVSANPREKHGGFLVSPLSINFKTNVHSQDFLISTSYNRKGVLKVTPVEIIQNEGGGIEYVPLDPKISKNIVTLETTRKVFHGPGLWNIKGMLHVNSLYFKKHSLIGIRIEEEDKKSTSDVNGPVVTVSLAYVVYLKIDLPKNKIKLAGSLTFGGFENDKGITLYNVFFHNKSNKTITLDAELTLRDDNKRLVYTSSLNTPQNQKEKKKKEVRILAGNKIKLISTPIPVTNPGKYYVSIVTKLDKEKNRVYSKQVEITKQDFDQSNFSVSHEKLIIPYKPGSVAQADIEVTNPSPEVVTAYFDGKGSFGKEMGGYGWMYSSIDIAPHSTETNRLKLINFGNDASLDDLQVTIKSKNQEILKKIKIPAVAVTAETLNKLKTEDN